ncbi:hypothetical protein D3C71_2161210 [compost metagenome]
MRNRRGNCHRKNGQIYKVYRVYTEREPCIIEGHNCKDLLAKELPDADVTYSVGYGTRSQEIKEMLI